MAGTRHDELFGLLAEFEHPEDLVQAIRRVREAGYTQTDAFTPFPMDDVSEAMGCGKTHVPLLTLAGGVIGAVSAFGFMTWTSVIDYPWNVGGRPLFSWPAFIPITFELTILFAALAGAIGMLVLNGLPRPYHPVFNVPQFDRASHDRFFLCIEARDEQFDPKSTRAFLESLDPLSVSEVPH